MKRSKQICQAAFLVCILFILVFSASVPEVTVQAAGLVDETVDNSNLYSKYPISNYQLDFYVDTTWDFLPWNWIEGIGSAVTSAVYAWTNSMWRGNVLLGTGVGYVVQEAYELDFISNMAENIGKNIQTLAGLSKKGIAKTGFYPGFLQWIILAVGVYVAYVGLVKREISKAVGAVMNMLMIFLLSSAFIVYAPDVVKNINEFSSDVSTGALTVGTKLVISEDEEIGNNATDKIRNSLFAIQVYKPWLLLQYGTTDEESIGKERIESVLSVNPWTNFGNDRDAVVKAEVETYKNGRMTVTGAMTRLGEVMLIGVINIIISIFVFFMAGMMILSQLLFIIFVMFLPISFVLSMFPGYNGLAKKAVMKVFNTIMMRAGLTLIVTISLSLSAMLYSMSSDYPFIMIAFLQIVVFAGIYLKMNDILGMISLQDADSNGKRRGSFMRSMTRYLVMRRLLGHWGGRRAASSSNRTTSQNRTSVSRDSGTPGGGARDVPQNEDTIRVNYGMTGTDTVNRRRTDADGSVTGEQVRRPVYGDVVDWEKNVGDLKEFEAEQQKWSEKRRQTAEMYRTAEQMSHGTVRAARDRRELKWYVDGMDMDKANSATPIGASGELLKKYRGHSGIKRAAKRGSIYRDSVGRIRPMKVFTAKEEDMTNLQKVGNSDMKVRGNTRRRMPTIMDKNKAENETFAESELRKERERSESKYNPVRGPQLSSGVKGNEISSGQRIGVDAESLNRYRAKVSAEKKEYQDGEKNSVRPDAHREPKGRSVREERKNVKEETKLVEQNRTRDRRK